MTPLSYRRKRAHCRGVRAALAAAAIVAALSGSAAAQSTRHESILLDDPRPVAAALDVLATRHRRVITYEDPRYLYADDIKDVTLETRRDLASFPPGQAPKVLIPLGGRIDFKYDVSAVTGDPGDWEALLAELLESHAAGGRGGRFRLERAGDVYHVIPAEIRNTAGRWVRTASILDAYITVPEQELTRSGIVEAVAKAIGEAMNVGFGVGTCLDCGPRAIPEVPTERFAVNNERARDVLLRVLEHLRPGTGWRIFQQPGTDQYFLNLTFSPRPTFVPPPALAPPPTASDASPTRVRPECQPSPARPRPCPRTAPQPTPTQPFTTQGPQINPGE